MPRGKKFTAEQIIGKPRLPMFPIASAVTARLSRPGRSRAQLGRAPAPSRE